MRISVRLFATFREGRQKMQTLEVAESTTPEQIFELLGIVKSQVSILLINGRDGKPDNILMDGDTLSLFPPVGGG